MSSPKRESSPNHENHHSDKPESTLELRAWILKEARRRFGPKAAIIASILIALSIAGVEYGPKIWMGSESLYDVYRREHPSIPVYQPSQFTVGVAVYKDGHWDRQFFDSLRSRFWNFPGVEIRPLELGTSETAIAENSEKTEEFILRWLEKSGASGVVWGEGITTTGGSEMDLRWSRPEYMDYAVASDYSFLSLPRTVAFPRIGNELAPSLVAGWIISHTSRLNRELGRDLNYRQEPEKHDKESLQLINKQMCDTDFEALDCKMLSARKLDMFLVDDDSRYWWGDVSFAADAPNMSYEEKELYDTDIFFLRATGQFASIPKFPETEEDYQLLNQAFSYLVALASRKPDGKPYLDRAANWINRDCYEFGLEIERLHPEFCEVNKLMRIQLSMLRILDNPNSVTKSQEKEIRETVQSFVNASHQLAARADLTSYQKGVVCNHLGVGLMRVALVFKGIGIDTVGVYRDAASALRAAVSFLGAYDSRIPRYLAATELNYSQALLNGAGSAYIAETQAEKAKELAISQKSRVLETESLRQIAWSTFTIAKQRHNSHDYCVAVNRWSGYQRIKRRGLSLGPDDDDAIFDQLMASFYKDASRPTFEKCLQEASYDFNAIEQHLKTLSEEEVQR